MLEKSLNHSHLFKNNKFNKKKFAFTAILSVFFIQCAFFTHNYYRLEHYVQEQNEISEKIYSSFSEFKKSLSEGKEQRAIELFRQLKNKHTPIGDLLLSSGLSILLLQNNINPATLKTLLDIYQNDRTSSASLERKKINELSCFIGDISCYVFKPIFQKELQKSLSSIEPKIIKNDYNLSHWTQYQLWYKDLGQHLKNKDYAYLDLEPGKQYINTIFR